MMNHSYDSIMTFIYYYSKPRLRHPLPGEALFPLPCKITNNSKSLGTPNPDSHFLLLRGVGPHRARLLPRRALRPHLRGCGPSLRHVLPAESL